ncbi:MAG: hypothetical protein R3C09_25085 [Pirellulaceae bacterium]
MLFEQQCGTVFLDVLSPTLDTNLAHVESLPLPAGVRDVSSSTLCEVAKADWDSFEYSWDFQALPLLSYQCHELDAAFSLLREDWRNITKKITDLEENNNRHCISVCGLDGELTPSLPPHEITLTCNPHYRYDKDKSESELESLLLGDTMREFISYAVGCMLGRYSLDKPGLILANQGETTDDYLLKVSNQTEPLNEDRAISEPDSVVFVSGAAVACFSCGDTVPTDQAAFVISEYEQGATPLRGRPLIYCSKCG